jgi:hypothetical protein
VRLSFLGFLWLSEVKATNHKLKEARQRRASFSLWEKFVSDDLAQRRSSLNAVDNVLQVHAASCE